MTIDKYLKKEAFKIVIAGDGAVGKTSTAKRLAGNLNVNEILSMTPGIDFQSVQIQSYETIECQLWDLGGQEQFRKFQDDFFQGATIIIFMFTVDRYSSFMNLKSWVSLIPKNVEVSFFLLANKVDALNRVVDRQHAIEFANVNNMTYYEVSALTGKGFDEFREDLFKTIEYLYIVKKEA
ncbi:MAG: Rab family GTPase [Promethearchaeota archaeon]